MFCLERGHALGPVWIIPKSVSRSVTIPASVSVSGGAVNVLTAFHTIVFRDLRTETCISDPKSSYYFQVKNILQFNINIDANLF